MDQQHQVRLDYYVPTRDESTERVVDPLRVVTAGGNTYLEAYCHLAEDQRLFRLDRISRAEVLDSRVEEHAGLEPRDLAAGIFQPSGEDLLVTLRLAPNARWVAEYYPVEATEDLRDGGLTGPSAGRGPGLADPADAPARRLRGGRGPPRAGGRCSPGGHSGFAQLHLRGCPMGVRCGPPGPATDPRVRWSVHPTKQRG